MSPPRKRAKAGANGFDIFAESRLFLFFFSYCSKFSNPPPLFFKKNTEHVEENEEWISEGPDDQPHTEG